MLYGQASYYLHYKLRVYVVFNDTSVASGHLLSIKNNIGEVKIGERTVLSHLRHIHPSEHMNNSVMRHTGVSK